MMQIVLNEREWITTALENNDLGGRPLYAVQIYARYLIEGGCGKSEARKKISEMLLRYDSSINLFDWDGTIEYAIRHAGDRKLIEVNGVNVTESEINKIKSVDGPLRQRLLFTVLCLSKYYYLVSEKCDYWFKIDAKDLFNMANVVVSNTKRGLMLNDLIEAGMIAKGRRVDSVSYRSNFIDDDSPTIISVDDFRNLGFRYESISSNEYITCDECGLLVRRKGRRQKYCKECAKRMDRQHALERYYNSVA